MGKHICNVGRLRKLIEKLPDEARILPDWAYSPPGDSDPAVSVEGFKIARDGDGPYLSVLVDIQYLEDITKDEEN